jgi:hypothetical protein
MIYASISTQKVFNNHTKLSKTKMQITHYKQFAFFITLKSYQFQKSYQQVTFSILEILALQHVTPLSSTC